MCWWVLLLFCEIPKANEECQDDRKIPCPPQGPPYNLCPYEKHDLLCKTPGFQDSPIATSRTCKIALKAPLETSYTVLAGLFVLVNYFL